MEENGTRNAGLEADVLLAAAVGRSKEYLLIHDEEPVEQAVEARYRAFIERRGRGEPAAYITGRKEFYNVEFVVSPDVLIPRPETELLVERALACFSPAPDSFFVVDIGCGSGCIALALLHELRTRHGEHFLGRGRTVGMDISPAALCIARLNASRLGLSSHIWFAASDLFTALAPRSGGTELFLVVSNPPYIPEHDVLPDDVQNYEPKPALRAGAHGLDVIAALVENYRLFAMSARRKVLLMECGFGQADGVKNLLCRSGFSHFSFYKDLQQLDRIVEVMG